MRKASLFDRARGRARLRGGRQRDHERRSGRERASGGRRAARDARVLRRHVGGMHGHADLGPRVPDCRALRPGREPGRGHLRDLVRRGVEPRPTGAPGTAIPSYRQSRERSARSRGRRVRDSAVARASRRRGCPAAGSLSNLPERPAVHAGRLRRAVGHERAGRQDVPLPGRPLPHGRHAQHGHQGLAEAVREPLARRRQHLLRRLRRPELPRRRRLGDEHRRGDDDHRRHAVPVDERGLPARHALGEGVPRAVRHAARNVEGLEAPDHEGAVAPGLPREGEPRRPLDERAERRLELDPRERRADADVDAAAEADVLGGVRAGDVEAVRRRRTPAGRGSPRRRAARPPRRAGSGRPASSTPSSSTQRSKSWSGGSQRISSSTAAAGATVARDEPLPLLGVAQQRADAVAERVHGRLVAGVQQHDDVETISSSVSRPPSTSASTSARDEVVARRAAALLDELDHVVAELGRRRASPTRPAPGSCRTRTSSRAGATSRAGRGGGRSGTPSSRQMSAIEYGCAKSQSRSKRPRSRHPSSSSRASVVAPARAAPRPRAA